MYLNEKWKDINSGGWRYGCPFPSSLDTVFPGLINSCLTISTSTFFLPLANRVYKNYKRNDIGALISIGRGTNSTGDQWH